MLQWLQPHRREKYFAKPEEVIQSSQYAVSFLFYLFIYFYVYPFSCICSQRPNFKAGNYGGIRTLSNNNNNNEIIAIIIIEIIITVISNNNIIIIVVIIEIRIEILQGCISQNG